MRSFPKHPVCCPNRDGDPPRSGHAIVGRPPRIGEPVARLAGTDRFGEALARAEGEANDPSARTDRQEASRDQGAASDPSDQKGALPTRPIRRERLGAVLDRAFDASRSGDAAHRRTSDIAEGMPGQYAAQATAARSSSFRRSPPLDYARTRAVDVDPGALEAMRVMLSPDAWGLEASHKLLRTRLLQLMRANGWRTLAVTSPRANAGKTLVACNLAVGVGQEADLKALLVDVDLREPAVGRHFGLTDLPGFGGVIVDGVPLESALVHPRIGDRRIQLVLLAGGQAQPASAEILGSPAVASLVRELAQRYEDRIVVFDVPPLLDSADALAFLPNADAVLLVAEEGRTTYDDLERAQELLEGSNLIGVVLDKASHASTMRRANGPGVLARLAARLGL